MKTKEISRRVGFEAGKLYRNKDHYSIVRKAFILKTHKKHFGHQQTTCIYITKFDDIGFATEILFFSDWDEVLQ